jgi:phenylalanyl-tRNA synthetase alpha chain
LKAVFAEFKNVPNEQKKIWTSSQLVKTSAEDKVKAIQEALESKEKVKVYGDLTRSAEPVIMVLVIPFRLLKIKLSISFQQSVSTCRRARNRRRLA